MEKKIKREERFSERYPKFYRDCGGCSPGREFATKRSVRDVISRYGVWLSHAKCPVSLCHDLLRYSPPRMPILDNLAKNPYTSSRFLYYYLSKKDKESFKGVPRTKEEILRLQNMLKTDRRLIIRHSLACKHDSPEEILRLLSEDKNYYVLATLVENKNCPKGVIPSLVGKSSYLDSRIVKSIACPKEVMVQMSDSRKIGILRGLAGNPKLSKSLFGKLFECRRKYVIKTLAENPKCPESILLEAANSKWDTGRYAVACNENTPESILHQILYSGDVNLRRRAYENLLRRNLISRKRHNYGVWCSSRDEQI